MPPTNIIVYGTFDLQGVGWSGTDIEVTFTENSYFANGSTNRVAEIDGATGQTTVMQQSFSVTGPLTTELTFEAALRTTSVSPGSDGFVVQIVNSSNVVIATETVLPSVGVYATYTVPVSFPAGTGTYTLRFRELGDNNSFGAIVDNIELLVCFAGATRIETPFGQKAARDIKVGDLIVTERGVQPVTWVGRRRVSAKDMAGNEKYLPVRIGAGPLGAGLPRADLWVSRQHRMLVRSPICTRMFGADEVLVSAIKLTSLPGIAVDTDVAEIDYVHLLFADHDVVFAEGAPSESLLLHAEALAALSPEAREEIELLFPDLTEGAAPVQGVRLIPEGYRQVRLADRIGRNGRTPLEGYRRVA